MQCVEVDAFASVHDMIHAAIQSYGASATLREVRHPVSQCLDGSITGACMVLDIEEDQR